MRKDETRKSTSTGVAIVSAVVIFGLCAAASAGLAAYHRQTIDTVMALWRSWANQHSAKTDPAPIEKKSRIDKVFVPSPALMKSELAVKDTGFTLADKFAATDFCAVLRPAFSPVNLVWQKNSLFSEASDCTAEFGARSGGDQSLHNSLFFQTTRNMQGASMMLRLKLVYLPGQGEKDFRTQFEAAADMALAYLVNDDRAAILENIKSLTPFTVEVRGLNLRFFEEKMTPGAYNLMIDAKCGKFQCQATNPYYKLSLPAGQAPVASSTPQQE